MKSSHRRRPQNPLASSTTRNGLGRLVAPGQGATDLKHRESGERAPCFSSSDDIQLLMIGACRAAGTWSERRADRGGERLT